MSINKKIAKNSLILYGRLIVTSIIGLYSSRLVLQELGINDFGLYGIVGGIVTLLNFMNSSMITTSNRFIAVELGKKENQNINKIFNTVLIIHILFAFVILIFGEILGGWYIRNHLNIEVGRISDALFVLHFSLFSAVLSTILVPYQGLLTAFEKFNVKTILEILQSALHLLIIVIISFLVVNKLRMYASLVFITVVIVFIFHVVYLKKKFKKETAWKLNRKKSDYKEVSVFFGWSMFYVIGSIFSKQGAELMLNSFFGTVLNAAFAIARQVMQMVFSFVTNLNQAAIPQIMINFGAGKQEKSLTLIYSLSKYTFFIMYIVSLPLLLSINPLLELWLDEVPKYSSIFASLMIIHALICCLESGFDAAIDSTGNIKKTKIYFNIITISTLPIIYFLYYFGFPPFTLTIVAIVAEIVFLNVQLKILQNLLNLNIKDYFRKTIIPVGTVVAITLPQIYLRTLIDQSFLSTIIFSSISVISTFFTILFLGLNFKERNVVLVQLNNIKQKYIK